MASVLILIGNWNKIFTTAYDSTENAVQNLLNQVHHAFDNGEFVIITFLDLTRAFDFVNLSYHISCVNCIYIEYKTLKITGLEVI